MPIDFGDEAQAINEKHLEVALSSRKKLTVPFSGFCLSCEEPIGQRRFCDSTCREEWERQRRSLR